MAERSRAAGGAGRREQILDGVVRILARDGVDRLRIRAVAEEAGSSVGAVQHFFATRNEMVHAAMEHVSTQVTARLLATIEAGDAASVDQQLRAACRILAGVADNDRPATTVWLAFTSLACTDPMLAASHQKAWAQVEAGLLVLLRRARQDATADDAAELLALIDGVAVARATEPERMSSERADRLLTRSVARACGVGA